MVKYLNRDKAPEYGNVPLIAQLRTLATTLQRDGDRDRPSTVEELRRQNRWLSWYVTFSYQKITRPRKVLCVNNTF